MGSSFSRFKVGRTLPLALFFILITLVGVIFFLFAQKRPDSADTMGYVHAGKRLASGNGLTFEDPNNQLAGPYFSMYAFQIRRAADDRLYLGFPPGFPILLALGIMSIGKLGAVHYVVPGFAILGLGVTFYLGKLLSESNWTALGAAVLLAVAPAYWQFGTASWSEVPAMTIMAAGVCFYLLSRRQDQPKLGMVLLSVMGGLLIAYSFFIRYANVAFLPALGLYELFRHRARLLKEWQRWPFFVVLALSVASILLFNHFYYGGAFLTSYSPAHGWYPHPAFSFSYAIGPSFVGGYSLIEAGKTLWHNFPGLLLLVPVGWVLLKRASGLLTAVATLSTVGLYGIYAFAPADVNSRFLIPIFPFLAVAMAHTIAFGSKRLPQPWQRGAVGVILVIWLFWPVPGRIEQLRTRNVNSQATVDHVRRLVSSTPPDAVFMSYTLNDQIAFYGERSVLNSRRIPPSDPEAGRYRLESFEPCLMQTVDRLLQRQIPVYYIEDRSPSLWESLAILQSHFQTELVSDEPPIYRVTRDPQTEIGEGELDLCRQGSAED